MGTSVCSVCFLQYWHISHFWLVFWEFYLFQYLPWTARKRRLSTCSSMVLLSVRLEMLHRIADTPGSFCPGLPRPGSSNKMWRMRWRKCKSLWPAILMMKIWIGCWENRKERGTPWPTLSRRIRPRRTRIRKVSLLGIIRDRGDVCEERIIRMMIHKYVQRRRSCIISNSLYLGI